MTPSMPDDGYMDLTGRYHYVATFAGFVPAEQPELSIIVVHRRAHHRVLRRATCRPRRSPSSPATRLRRYDIPPAAVSAQAGRARGVGVGPAAWATRRCPCPHGRRPRPGRLTDAPRRAPRPRSAPVPASPALIVDERHVDPSTRRHPLGHPRLGGRRARHAVLLRARAVRPTATTTRPAAVEAGAVALLAERRARPAGARSCSCRRCAAAMGLVASAFHGDPSQRARRSSASPARTARRPSCHLLGVDLRGRRAGRAG